MSVLDVGSLELISTSDYVSALDIVDLVVHEGYAYALGPMLSVVDVSNLLSPKRVSKVIGVIPQGTIAVELVIGGGHAYMLSLSVNPAIFDTISVLDISSPTSVRVVSTYSLDTASLAGERGGKGSIAYAEGLLYVTGVEPVPRLHVLLATNPLQLTLIQSIEGHYQGVQVQDSHLYAWGTESLDIYNLPTAPHLPTLPPTPGPTPAATPGPTPAPSPAPGPVPPACDKAGMLRELVGTAKVLAKSQKIPPIYLSHT
eukprot:Sspe_Gene.110440::Locus_91339_Transcript_1_1_Confidence_1.000_Length_1873::g.110440::m.110440